MQKSIVGGFISRYANDGERHLFNNFLIKPSVLAIFLRELVQTNNKALTIADLGCGNGTNSRVIAKGIFDIFGLDIKVNIIFVDVSSILLEESEKRSLEFKRNYKNFSWKLVQVDFNNPEYLSQFARDHREAADLVFSIKFLHNTNVKINKHVSKAIASITKKSRSPLLEVYYTYQYAIERYYKKI